MSTTFQPKTSAKTNEPERAHNILRPRRPAIGALFAPKSVAVIGATEANGSVGRTILENLTAQAGQRFRDAIYPVNPKREKVLGLKAYPCIADVPAKVDLAVVVTPATTVPGLIKECAEAGVKGVVIISAGFKEAGAAGIELERQIAANQGEMRIIGPNCLGVMIPPAGLNATFAAVMARRGSVAFISQSGALCTAILDWSLRENVGFSAFVSIGSMLDVGWGDLIYQLGDDPYTKSIVIYMESIGDARAFLSAAREVALTKPIIVIKVGRTEAAAEAAASHTGSLTGSDEVIDAAFRRVGVLRVDTIGELFDMAEVLGKQPRPRGPRLAIVTNGGGPGGLATDMLVGSGGELAQLTPESLAALDRILPSHWSHGNPVDLLGEANAETYARAVEIVQRDPNTDGALVILTPQAMTDATETAKQIAMLRPTHKPLLAAWMGAAMVEAGEEILNEANIPSFKYPDRAARAFDSMWRYSYNLRALYETPALAADSGSVPDRQLASDIVLAAREASRLILSEDESKQILEAYGIPTVPTYTATNEEEALQFAQGFGFPVVLKLYSRTITHKSDVGGVKLNLGDAAAVRQAFRDIKESVSKAYGKDAFSGVTVQPMITRDGFELILGSSLDPQFGPVLLFGAGGLLVEVFKDHALGLPPLTATLARRMMEQTHIFNALKGVRGREAVDIDALAHLLVRFSQLVVEQRWIKEIDINPLLVSGSEGFIALDARMILHGADIQESDLPALAIRPYPIQYVESWSLRDGTPVVVRPIRPEDEPLIIEFHKTLSERSVQFRYFSLSNLEYRVAHERLTRICFNDYDREIALVVDRKNAETGVHEILGVGRLSKTHSLDEAEFAIIISDQWQRHGIGARLLKKLVQVGRSENLTRIVGHILEGNAGMRNIAEKAGFQVRRGEDEYIAEIHF